MKKTKILSLLLCLSLFCALIVPCTKAYAKSDPDSGMKISKTATANGDGSYTITLEAFATGSKVITEQKTDIPTDIVLVLDQSGSMAHDIGQVQYTAYTGNNTQNKSNYEKRHNGGSANLWHKLPDGSFVSVSVTLQQTITYNKITNGRNDSDFKGYTNYWENRDNLYTYVGGEIKKVVYTRERDGRLYKYTYALEDGTILNQNTENIWYQPIFQHTDDGHLYLAVADESQNVYTYTYTDTNGTTQTIDTSTGANREFTPAFYQRSTTTSGGGSRLKALKNAATTFANAVAAKAAGADGDINTTADNINHRIAVVGYADTNRDYGYNTGVFIGSTLNRYENNAAGVYSTALQDMSTTNGKSNVTASLNALQASGATRTDYGLIMAKGILDANPVPTGETRNRVVIVFTDGSPTDWNGFELDVANSAISTANAIKAGGTTVYSIGIFSGADASSAGTEPREDLRDSSGQLTAACNWFMQKVSSNNGTPRTPSYYLSAADADSLNSIFKQISDQIETGGSSSTLTSEAVVKDIIAPQFTLPESATDANITLETYKCTGKSGDAYTWSKNTDAMGAKASISGDQVNVTGFNFSENYVGTVTENGNTTYRGNKLVISFKVESKQDFLGGNDVYTNTDAGIYENGSAENPLLTFDRPTVNVPIKDVTVTAQDKNVYLKGEVTADQLKDGSEISVGDVELDLSKATDTDKPYGLDPWQTEYVNITVTVKDEDGNPISDELADLTDDTTYTVTVKVSPKTDGSSASGTPATEKNGENEGKINVFKPELTFKDSEVYYGDNVPTDYSGNLVSTKWFHTQTVDGQEVKTEDQDVTMVGAPDVQAPVLSVEYIPDASKIKDGRINTKDDIPVAVDVKILDIPVNSYITFVHQACNPACDWNETDLDGNPAFLLHVKTCTLTITKQDGVDGEPYVFGIYKDGEKYSEVTIVGNNSETLFELPVGTYTISENTGWSWRFNPSYSENVILSKDNTTGTITCTNTKNNDQWLNGFSDVVKNIFGVSHNN